MTDQPATDTPPVPRTFGDLHRAILEFEAGGWWKYLGAKHADILDRFAMTPVRYYAELGWILNQPEAQEYDPQTVDRLVRIRDLRRAVRTVGTVGPHPDHPPSRERRG